MSQESKLFGMFSGRQATKIRNLGEWRDCIKVVQLETLKDSQIHISVEFDGVGTLHAVTGGLNVIRALGSSGGFRDLLKEMFEEPFTQAGIHGRLDEFVAFLVIALLLGEVTWGEP